MSQQKVRNAIVKSASEALVDKAVAWPNKAFKPPGGLWFSVQYLPTPPTSVTLGLGGEEELRAILQIDVNVPTDSGEKEQMAALALLETLYIPGLVVRHQGQSARVLKCARSNGRVVNSDWRVSLSVYFLARYVRGEYLPPDVIGAIGSDEIEVISW
jgi:hypothetical protein